MRLTIDQNNKVKAYIIESIYAEGYPENPVTDKEKLQFLYDTFKDEYGFMIKRIGEYNAFSEWLRGLPTAINIHFYNCDIIKYAEDLGTLKANASDNEQYKIINNWFNFITGKTFVLFNKYKIN